MRTHLDLFSGIGGFALAAQWNGIETLGFCEIEPFAKRVLTKNFPNIPIHEDVRRTEDFEQYAGRIDLLTGGYPCQPFSVAGKQRGSEDDRHLWPAMLSVIKRVRPTWILAENVAGHIKLGLDEVLSDLEAEGYSARTIIVPACAVGAEHRRDRVWIIANSECGNGEKLGVSERSVLEAGRKAPDRFVYARNYGVGWNTESRVLRSRDGVSFGVDRLKGLGNAIVPQVAAEIIKAMQQAEDLNLI